MQELNIKKINELIEKANSCSCENIKNTKEYKELMRNKTTKTIRILESINEMLITHCKDQILNPSQFASTAIAEKLIREIIFKKKEE